MRTAAVIGYGRFGKLWAEILSPHYRVKVHDLHFSSPSVKHLQFTTLKNALDSDLVFLCIPISVMEEFLKESSGLFKPESVVFDTASVKVRPLEWMDKYLGGIPHAGLHPLFGPDSYRSGQSHRIILTPSDLYTGLVESGTKIIEGLGLECRVLSAGEHDESISSTQGMTHLIGNILMEMDIQSRETPTRGFTLLKDVERFCRNDTNQLFRDMLAYNPYTREMVKQFSGSFQAVLKEIEKNALLEKAVPDIGIMGVEGSFSHEASERWLSVKGISDYRIHYLVTAENVLSALDTGQIRLGFLALQNAAGGVVLETIEGLSRHSRINIQEYFPFEVRQCLMKRRDSEGSEPVSVHSHPQALKQCRRYLQTFFRDVPIVEEEDTALSARKLGEGLLDRDAWVIAPEACSRLYDLELVKKGIQDLDYNPTDFIIIGKV